MKRKYGFTLIELLFIILLFAIIMGISLFRLGFDFTTKSKARTSAQRIVSDLRLTRRLAITDHQDYKLTIYPAEQEYKIFDSGNTQVGHTRTIDPDISLSGDTDFIFESLGNASSGSSLSVSAGASQYDISVISATGMTSMVEQ